MILLLNGGRAAAKGCERQEIQKFTEKKADRKQ